MWWWLPLLFPTACRAATVSEVDAAAPAVTVATPGGNLVLLPNPAEVGLPEGRIRGRHIMIAKSKHTKDEARKRIDEVLAKLQGGADFAALASEYGEDATRVRGGDLGVFSRGELVLPVSDAAFALKVNEISPVVESDPGFHIIQRVE